jgi:geranylgeranyl diphosphate synthase type II
MDVEDYLKSKAAETESALKSCLKQSGDVPQNLLQAIHYCLFGGGKRFRPALALGASEIVSGTTQTAVPLACALEMIHTYSLVHDDLPAMDDDDLRRGKPTAHKQFDEATAILIGDALQCMAFEVLAETENIRVIRDVAKATGVSGMVGGQFLDLEGENRELSLEQLQQIHRSKTGALIAVSCRGGAILGNGTEDQIEALTRYGEHVGLAFQITDDILDVVGVEEELGKPVGSDEEQHKSTYPALLGIDKSRDLAQHAVDDAMDSLTSFGEEAKHFRSLASYIVERNR